MNIDKTREDLDKKGFAVGINGASYKLTTFSSLDIPAVERTFKGDREIIVGYSGEQFSSLDAAKHWAVVDSYHEYKKGEILPNRKQLI